MRLSSTSFATVLAASAAFALAPASAQAPAWEVDYAESSIVTTVKAQVPGWGPASIDVKYPEWTADIRWSAEDLAASSVRVEVDLTALSTGMGDITAEAKGPAWLNVGEFSTAVFASDEFEALGGDRFVAAGTLTIHGQTQPLDLEFTLERDGETARLTAEQEVLRTRWNIDNDGSAEENNVEDAVILKLDVEAALAG